ncbi:MAG TPA: glycosyltransferase family 4 protein, partial [Ktedonobacteraceae bacterium]|nr:glycosyltransferase family 4 protein [Ktedonobacteraceae bacterium]
GYGITYMGRLRLKPFGAIQGCLTESNMRILMLTQFYPPIIGGGAIYARSLGHELVSRGHDVAVATLWHEGQAEFELDKGVRVYRIRSSMRRLTWLFSDNNRQYAPPFPDPEAILELRRIIIRERPEIVHAHNWLVYSFLPLKVWSKAKLVVTLHNYSKVCVKTTLMRHEEPCEGPSYSKCFNCAVQYYGLTKGTSTILGHKVMGLAERNLVDMYLAVSQSVAIDSGLVSGQQPYQVIPNFISDDANAFIDDTEAFVSQLPPQGFLLFAGALSKQKGVDVLLRAYADLTNAPPLVLIGYQTRDWPAMAKDCPANVFILNDWPRYAVLEAWHRSIIALAPSVGPEAFGLVVVEAMSAGRPVIASCIGGMADLVTDGETGLLVEPGDTAALRLAIKRLLSNSELRSRMGQAALQKVVEYQASSIVPRIEQVYEELLGEKAGSASENDPFGEDLAIRM